MADQNQLDPIEKALNDAATKTGALWISFISLVVYLVIAVGSVTHRMLFLQEPIKLPVLNVDLPLVGFFVVAPLLLVTYHFYVLLQLAGLASKAAAYEMALQSEIPVASERELRRQRLDQSPFVQLLAGTALKDRGFVRAATVTISVVTLVIAPIITLLMTQMVFLPYHDALVTWLHRLALLANLFLLWAFWRIDTASPTMGPTAQSGLQPRHVPVFAAALVLTAFSVFVATFPGETPDWTRSYLRGANELTNILFNGPVDSVSGNRLSWWSNTLVLSEQDLVDRERADVMERRLATETADRPVADSLRPFRARDLRGAVLNGVDLRFADFTAANLRDASMVRARLTGAKFDCVFVTPKDVRPDRRRLPPDRDFNNNAACTSLVGTKFDRANLQSASFEGARAIDAVFDSASLQGAIFRHALIVGSSFQNSLLQGADFEKSTIIASRFSAARMYGASFVDARIYATTFFSGYMSGVDFTKTEGKAVNFLTAQLHGANFDDARFDVISLFRANLWRARVDDETFSNVVAPQLVATPTFTKPREFKDGGRAIDLSVENGLKLAITFATNEIISSIARRSITARLQSFDVAPKKSLAATTKEVRERMEQFEVEGDVYRTLSAKLYGELVCGGVTSSPKDDDDSEKDDGARFLPALSAQQAVAALRGLVRGTRILALQEHAQSFLSLIKDPDRCPVLADLDADSYSAVAAVTRTAMRLFVRQERQKEHQPEEAQPDRQPMEKEEE